MARIVNPNNLDDSDDAVFAYLLTEGLIWIEDDDDDNHPYGLPAFEMIELERISESTTHTLKGHTGKINALSISAEFLISGSTDKTLRVWNWKTGQPLAILRGHTGSVNELITNGEFVISSSSDKTLRVWNWKTGRLLRTIDEFKYDISEIAMADQFVFVVSVSTILIWNWQTGEFIQKYHDGTGHIVVDGDLLLSVESSGSLRVKNWKTNQTIHAISEHTDDVFIKDDIAIFVDEFDGIRVWNWKTGDYSNKSEFMTKSRSQIANKVLQTSSSLNIYDAKTDKCYFHMSDEVLAFADNYSHVISSDGSGGIHVALVAPVLQRLILTETSAEQSSLELRPQYDTGTILEEARNYILKRNEKWVNFTRVSQHLYETFPNLNLKTLVHSDKRHKNLRNLLDDYPAEFELRQDSKKQGLYWVRLRTKK